MNDRLVATTGIEPVTSALWVPRSNQLSYVAIGRGTRTRTLEMAESESAALPLGYTPIFYYQDGRGTWDRTRAMAGSKPAALPLGYTPTPLRDRLLCQTTGLIIRIYKFMSTLYINFFLNVFILIVNILIIKDFIK